MDDVQLDECVVRKRDCLKVVWKTIPVGLITLESGTWRYTKDLKGEFWSFNEFSNKEDAVTELVIERQKLDEFRLKMISDK